MSEINNSINQVNTTAVMKTAESAASPKTAQPKAADSPAKAESAKDIMTEEYGPVVATSEDGDTVRVKNDEDKESDRIHEILQDEIERLKASEEDFETPEYTVHTAPVEDSREDETEESETEESETEEYEADITSYIGYSDSELKQMYLEGDISQIDYNREMEARKAREEAEASENDKFNKDIAHNISKLSEVAQTEKTVKQIENGDTSSTIPDEIRIQALQNFDTV